MTYAPHPWDEIGPPPPLGLTYEEAANDLPIDDALRFAELLMQVEDDRAEAERYEEAAAEKEAEAHELETALEAVEGLADAIREDPWAFGNAAEVRAWWQGRKP